MVVELVTFSTMLGWSQQLVHLFQILCNAECMNKNNNKGKENKKTRTRAVGHGRDCLVILLVASGSKPTCAS